MEIDKLKVNGFGVLENKEIDFEPGINVVFGKNESGKSSILKFISTMLYGASKNKNGKDVSDFDRFKPWQIEDFSGKISYSLDNGEYFEVYREFKKKNPIIYNSSKEDISKSFVIDKTKGIDFFTEQTGIDEDTFYNTAINEQEGIKLSKSSQVAIIQKISNLISTGDDNISFKKSLEKLAKRQTEEVGSERTLQRPINLLNNKIDKLCDQKRSLGIYKESIYDNSLERKELEEDLINEENKILFLKEAKQNLDNNRIKSAEINFNKNLESEYNEKIYELNQKIEKNEVQEKYEKLNFKNYYISLIILLIIFICLIVFTKAKYMSVIALIPGIYVLYKLITDKKNKKDYESTRNENISKIISEVDILKESMRKRTSEINEKEEKLKQEIERGNQSLTEKFSPKVDDDYLKENLNNNYDDILKEIKMQTIDNSTKNINDKLKKKKKIEEELEDSEEERDELVSLNNSYNVAKECLERAYNQVKENISPKFTKNLCKIISQISDGRYKNIVVSDDDGLKVEIENGNYVPVSRLSVGTIDQMYLSLRLSALSEISEESIPIVLDEAFAYFDDERLMNILKYLNKNYSNHQIIILTCAKREMEILDKLKINYNKIRI